MAAVGDHAAMTVLRLEQLALGPRDEGRNYGVLAATPDLRLPDEAISACQGFCLKLGDDIRPGAPIHAVFQISAPPARELWYACTTWEYEAIGRNRVWITQGSILTREDMQALQGRAHLLLADAAQPAAPALGDELAFRTVDVEKLFKAAARPNRHALPGEDSERAVASVYEALRRKQAVHLEVERPLAVLAVLGGVLDRLDEKVLPTLSYATAPATARQWNIVAFQAEDWPGFTGRGHGGRRITANAAGVNGAGPQTEADRLWKDLADAVEEGGQTAMLALSRRLRNARAAAHEGDATDVLQARITSLLDEAAEADAPEILKLLMRFAARLDPATRGPLERALLGGMEELLSRSESAAAWFLDLYRGWGAEDQRGRFESVIAPLNPPAMMMARLAVDYEILWLLPPEEIARLGPAVAGPWAAKVTRQLGKLSSAPDVEALNAVLTHALGVMEDPACRPETSVLAQRTLLAAIGRMRAADFLNAEVDGATREELRQLAIAFLQSLLKYRGAKGVGRMVVSGLYRDLSEAAGPDAAQAFRSEAKATAARELAETLSDPSRDGLPWRRIAFALAASRMEGRPR